MEEHRWKQGRGREKLVQREGGQREITGSMKREMDGGRDWREVKSGTEWRKTGEGTDGKLREGCNTERKDRERKGGQEGGSQASDSHICILSPATLSQPCT